jgi:hypothetical protein
MPFSGALGLTYEVVGALKHGEVLSIATSLLLGFAAAPMLTASRCGCAHFGAGAQGPVGLRTEDI